MVICEYRADKNHSVASVGCCSLYSGEFDVLRLSCQTTPMRPVTRKAEVQEERALIESEGPARLRRKAEKVALEARLKAMAPTIAWFPPARMFITAL